MSTSPPTSGSLDQIISRIPHLLLDFDGPICSVFAGISANQIAEQLRHRLSAVGIAVPKEAGSTSDPVEVFQAVAATGYRMGVIAQRELSTLELKAVRTARPTPGAADLMTAAKQSGRTITIVSNNSGRAITAYLRIHGLTNCVSTVLGRDDPNPARMKPSADLVKEAILVHETVPARCALIGDSVSDVIAAHSAGVAVIGYANNPAKELHLAEAGAEVVVTRLADITDALLVTQVRPGAIRP